MESERESGNSKPTTSYTKPSHDDGNPIEKGKLSHSSSSSSSSSVSSFDPLTDSDDGEKDVLKNSATKSEQNGSSSPKVGVVTLPENSAQTPEWSMISASPRAGPGFLSSQELSPQNPEWSMLTASPKQYPPIQTMGRPGTGYDPSRIPTSIFSSKPTNPMEWSVASNESLFSIHMGNNSFSKDNAILLGKFEELNKPADDLISFSPVQQPVTDAKTNEFNNSPCPLPTVSEVPAEDHRKSASKGEDSGVKEAADEKPKPVLKETADEKPKPVVKDTADDKPTAGTKETADEKPKADTKETADEKPKVDTKETTDEKHSKDTALPSEGVRISHNGSNMSDVKEMASADAARNSASTPRLSDESGTSSSSFAFPVFPGEVGRSGSVRVAPENLQPKPPEKPQSQPQPQAQVENPPKAYETRWFPSFSCRFLCC